MTANELIDLTLKEIAQGYHPGILAWMKVNRSEEWRKMLSLESEINEMASKGNVEGLKESLKGYKGLILNIMRIFKGV